MKINKEYLVNNGITSIEFVFENCETSIIDIDAIKNIKIIRDDTGTITYLNCELGLNEKCKYSTFGTNTNISPLERIHARADITKIYFHGYEEFLFGNIEWDEDDYESNSYQKSKMHAWNRLHLIIDNNTKIVKEYSYEETKDILKQVTDILCEKSSNNVNENLEYLEKWLKGSYKMKFNWKRFKVENIAVECCNKEEMVDFLDLLKNNDIDGHGLKEYLLENYLLENNEGFKYPIYFGAHNYSDDYSVEWDDGTYYQRLNYTILKWKNYMNCNSEYLGNELKED